MGLAVVPSGVSLGHEPGRPTTTSCCGAAVWLAEFPCKGTGTTGIRGKAPESQCGAQTLPPAPST